MTTSIWASRRTIRFRRQCILPGRSRRSSSLAPALEKLHVALKEKAEAWDAIVKIGRTHLMDATPIRVGQVFAGYAQQAHHGL